MPEKVLLAVSDEIWNEVFLHRDMLNSLIALYGLDGRMSHLGWCG